MKKFKYQCVPLSFFFFLIITVIFNSICYADTKTLSFHERAAHNLKLAKEKEPSSRKAIVLDTLRKAAGVLRKPKFGSSTSHGRNGNISTTVWIHVIELEQISSPYISLLKNTLCYMVWTLIPYSLFVIDCSLFLVPSSLLIVPFVLFLTPSSLFLIPDSSFPIPHSSFLIPPYPIGRLQLPINSLRSRQRKPLRRIQRRLGIKRLQR